MNLTQKIPLAIQIINENTDDSWERYCELLTTKEFETMLELEDSL
jgi:hypothetical protein